MNTDAAHSSPWTTAEAVFGLPLLAGIGAHLLYPLTLPEGPLRLSFIPLGIALALAGVVLIVLARRQFASHAQPTDPDRPTTKIIRAGVLSVSRNPLYLGCAVVVAGIALALNNLWMLIALLLSIVLCHRVLILPEERYLLSKFGSEYEAYMASVRRWLGRKRRG